MIEGYSVTERVHVSLGKISGGSMGVGDWYSTGGIQREYGVDR